MHREACFWLVIKAMPSTGAVSHSLAWFTKVLEVNFLTSCMSAIRSSI